MREKTAVLSLALMACIAPTLSWGKVTTSDELVLKANKLIKSAEREIQSGNYKRSSEGYQKSIGMLEQAQPWSGKLLLRAGKAR